MKTFLSPVILTIASIGFSHAQPGSPDKSFGNKGVVLDSSIWADCRAMAIQSDGKILTGGSSLGDSEFDVGVLYIARFCINGTPDLQFGINDKVMVQSIPGASPVYAKAIALQPDNKIMVCGRFVVNSPFGGVGLMRLLPDGRIDSSFGAHGFVITKLGKWNDNIGGMALQSDGKIVVSGNRQSDFSQSGDDFVLRYKPDGSPDQGFGNNGVVYTSYSSNITPGAVEIQPDGKILTGDIYGAANLLFQIVRYNTDGSLDESFGVNGIARLAAQAGFFYKLNDLAMQGDGKIVVAGQFGDVSMALARFDSTGQPDLAFGDLGGYRYFYKPDVVADAKSVFITAEKKIILTGWYHNEDVQVAAVRFNENGNVDSSFGENGVAAGRPPNINLGSDFTSGVGLLQQDGKVIVSGSFLQNDHTYNVAMFRYNGDDAKQPKYVKIKKWLHRHGFTWEDYPGNDLTYYSVQRSSNGSAFNEVARIFSRGNKTQYSYEDAAPLSGNSYYRLAAVSTNRSTVYSNIITIEGGGSSIKLYPNPVKGSLQIEGLPANQKSKLSITDIQGNTRMMQTTTSAAVNWNVAQLPKGNYLLKVISDNMAVTKSFIKE